MSMNQTPILEVRSVKKAFGGLIVEYKSFEEMPVWQKAMDLNLIPWALLSAIF